MNADQAGFDTSLHGHQKLDPWKSFCGACGNRLFKSCFVINAEQNIPSNLPPGGSPIFPYLVDLSSLHEVVVSFTLVNRIPLSKETTLPRTPFTKPDFASIFLTRSTWKCGLGA